MKITKSELREIIQEVADELGLFEGLTCSRKTTRTIKESNS